MTSRPWLVATVAALLVAVLQPAANASTPGLPEQASLRGCVDNHNLRLISFEHANSLLPFGFEAADASVILFASVGGLPVPQGRSVAVSPGIYCKWSDWEEGPVDINWIVVPVQQPVLAHVELDPSYIDLYLVDFMTSGQRTLRQFRQLGYAAAEGGTNVTFGAGTTDATLVPTPLGESRASDAAGTVIEFTVAGAAAVHSDFHVRVWFQTSHGVGFFTWDRSASTVFVGAMPTCRIRPGSVHARVVGTTDCSSTAPGGQDSIGATFSEQTDFDGDFRFFPGGHVEPR